MQLFYGSEIRSMDKFDELLKLTADPFAYTKEQLAYQPPPAGYDQDYKTYYGT